MQLRTNTTDQTRRPFWIQICLVAIEYDKYSDVFRFGIVAKFVCLRMYDNRAERGLIVEAPIKIFFDDSSYLAFFRYIHIHLGPSPHNRCWRNQ